MEQGVFASAGYDVAEYLLALQPHEDLCDTIMQEKKIFAEKFDCPAALSNKPQVTLARFKQHEMMEPHITRCLKNIATSLSSFKTELKGFGSFPSHTIYISITSKVQIMDIVKSIRASQKLMKLDDDNKPHFITDPYIQIAYKLLPWQYEKAWLEYEHKHFHGRFIASEIVLLKRKEGSRGYQPVEKFLFENVNREIVQGSLFK